ncbi:MAG: prepilin-type N-terminal cleavage/methylation domain-containing protein [Fimbriimonadaceae bacterium]|nr:prepilin-type N-terminal cleavage/methylation domain-containing protein [Fimbriimonadaceae bacterium]QYK56829.1 MAG: prepilin-type N-terminal cleavage/methylation domain-containing protein [Fimbriimonadaceae bacterium]
MNKSKAFTLIELLVVIAIIAILAAILFPVFAQAKQSAKNTVCLSNAKQIALAVKLYQGDADDNMPIFYAYNTEPGPKDPLHKGTERLLLPYSKSKDIFLSPNDFGTPFQKRDVPGTKNYWQAYGSSYRFTKCLHTVVEGESRQNNVPFDYSQSVTETMVEFPAEARALRIEIFPFFSRQKDPDCEKYGYDCDSPYDYYSQWSPTGGSVVFMDGHAKWTSGAGQFDQQVVSWEGHRSNDPNPDSWSGTWYGACD